MGFASIPSVFIALWKLLFFLSHSQTSISTFDACSALSHFAFHSFILLFIRIKPFDCAQTFTLAIGTWSTLFLVHFFFYFLKFSFFIFIFLYIFCSFSFSSFFCVTEKQSYRNKMPFATRNIRFCRSFNQKKNAQIKTKEIVDRVREAEEKWKRKKSLKKDEIDSIWNLFAVTCAAYEQKTFVGCLHIHTFCQIEHEIRNQWMRFFFFSRSLCYLCYTFRMRILTLVACFPFNFFFISLFSRTSKVFFFIYLRLDLEWSHVRANSSTTSFFFLFRCAYDSLEQEFTQNRIKANVSETFNNEGNEEEFLTDFIWCLASSEGRNSDPFIKYLIFFFLQFFSFSFYLTQMEHTKSNSSSKSQIITAKRTKQNWFYVFMFHSVLLSIRLFHFFFHSLFCHCHLSWFVLTVLKFKYSRKA